MKRRKMTVWDFATVKISYWYYARAKYRETCRGWLYHVDKLTEFQRDFVKQFNNTCLMTCQNKHAPEQK